jgi:hypothetical protein
MRLCNIAATMFMLPILSGCDLFQSTQAYVECTVALGGVSCSVERRQGNQNVTACWSVEFVCANSAKTSARACHPVPSGVGSKAVKAIAWDEFTDFKACDKVSSSSVGNLVMTPN